MGGEHPGVNLLVTERNGCWRFFSRLYDWGRQRRIGHFLSSFWYHRRNIGITRKVKTARLQDTT